MIDTIVLVGENEEMRLREQMKANVRDRDEALYCYFLVDEQEEHDEDRTGSLGLMMEPQETRCKRLFISEISPRQSCS